MRDAESVRKQQQQQLLQQHSCNLDECFQLYTKEEQVGLEATIIMKNTSLFSACKTNQMFYW